jgi:hypothetical protein
MEDVSKMVAENPKELNILLCVLCVLCGKMN